MPVVAMPDGANVAFPDDMPSEEIRALILQKFPNAERSARYSQQREEQVRNMSGLISGVGETISNIPGSAVKAATDIVQPIIHPIETAMSIKDIGEGVLQKVGIVSGVDKKAHADAVGQFFKERYGGWENIKATMQTDPVGFLLDLSTVLSGGGTLAARAPGIVGKVGEAAATAGRTIDPLVAAGKAAVGGGRLAANVIGEIGTHTGGEAIIEATKAGAKGGAEQKAFLQSLFQTVNREAIVEQAQAAVGKIKQNASATYRSGMVDVSADKSIMTFTPVMNALADQTKMFKGQDLAESTKVVRGKIDKIVRDWRNLDPIEFHTPEGFDALKQKIGDVLNKIPYEDRASRKVVGAVYNSIKSTIVDQAPTYASVMKSYEAASDAVQELQRGLSLKETAMTETALRKLQSAMKNNVTTAYGYRGQLLNKLEQTGASTLKPALAGQALSTVMPRGLGSAVAGGVGAAGILGHATGLTNPAALGILAASSPKLVGITAHGLGMASRLAKRPIGQGLFQTGRGSQQ